MIEAPVWGEAARQPEAPLPARAEVVVVGGGIAGVSLAYWLGNGGADVLLLERGRLASGASGRNAGFLLAGVSSSYAEAVASYGGSLAAEVWALTIENHDRLAELLAGRAGYRRLGSWTLAASPEEQSALRESAQLLADAGLPGAWVEDPGVPGGARGGLLNPGDGELQPVETVALVAAESQARIIDGVTVTGLEPSTDDVRVHTDRGEVAAGAVVMATNGYTRQLLPDIAIDPIRGQMLATEAGPARVAARPVYTDRGYVYWRQLADSRLIVGGYRHREMAAEVGYQELPTAAVQRHLDQHLADLGVTAPVSHRWAGVMGHTPDGLPLVGPLSGTPGIHLCAGFSGHGMGFAFNCARLLAASICGRAEVPRWLIPARAAP